MSATSGSDMGGLSGSEMDTSSSASSQQLQLIDTTATVSSPVEKRRKSGPRRPTLEPKGMWKVEEIDERTWAPTKPPKTMRRFRSVCGYVARARVSINLPHWKKVDREEQQKIVTEIMHHFHVDSNWKD